MGWKDTWHEAILGGPDPAGGVRCGLCPRRCRMSEGADGFCGVRGNREGRRPSPAPLPVQFQVLRAQRHERHSGDCQHRQNPVSASGVAVVAAHETLSGERITEHQQDEHAEALGDFRERRERAAPQE